VRDAGVDTLLLGCTHYPYLARVISDVMGRGVVLVSSADETAFEVAALLETLGLRRRGRRRQGTHLWLSSGDVAWFADLGRRLLGPELAAAARCAFDDPPED
jgi:glutamate racemase